MSGKKGSRIQNPEALHDLSIDALEFYRSSAKIEPQVGSDSFNRRLIQQGLLKQQDGRFTPSGFGLLLFGQEPRAAIPQAAMLATIHYPDGTEELKDFDGPNGAHELMVTADTITVKSPGGPLPPITLEQMQAFNAPMLSRNPELHYVFAQMEMAEERGLGIKSLKNRAQELALPLPRYNWDDPYLALTLFRNPESATRGLPASVVDSLNEDEKRGWQFLASKTAFTRAEYEEHMGVNKRKAQRHLKRFVELGLLRPIGSGPASKYEVLRP